MKKLSLIIVGAALAMSLAACKEDPHQLTTGESTQAELGARDIADRSGATWLGCSGQDSPPVDGYVTCTIKDKGGDKAEHELACSYKARGCKRK